MSWYKNLYLGKEAGRKKYKLIYDIDKGKTRFGVHVLFLAVNGTDLLDIVPAWQLSGGAYRGRAVEILGLAASYDEALEVGRDIIMDVYDKTGGFDVRGFFS